MKLIIEKTRGVVYAYVETEARHKKHGLKATMPLEALAWECNLEHYGDFVIVADLKDGAEAQEAKERQAGVMKPLLILLVFAVATLLLVIGGITESPVVAFFGFLPFLVVCYMAVLGVDNSKGD